MGLKEWVANWILSGLPQEEVERIERISKVRRYANGKHKAQLTVKPGQADDNITMNFIGVICQRAVSALFGNGFSLDFADLGESEQALYIKQVLDANHEEILFHRAALVGSEVGTIFLKIVPTDGLPRLILLNPEWVTVDTLPDDFEKVTRYTVQYTIGEDARRQVSALQDNGTWLVTDEVLNKSTQGKWTVTNAVQWPYDFPPILHWQNLPAANDCYGVPDITDDVIALQDRVNFVASNISKIIRYHAHPKTWGAGLPNPSAASKTSWGADEMVTFSDPNARIQNLEMQSDLASSERFLLDLRQAMFDLTRTVDLDSIADKVGSLTNFGLRVLYQDMLQKTATKRELYGDAIEELCRRLMILAGMDPIEVAVVWPEILPVNETETMAATEKALALGILSKQTAATENGYDWEKERQRIEDEAALGDNIGAQLLRAFNRGEA